MDSREALAFIIAAVTILLGLTALFVARRRSSRARGSGNLRIDLNKDERHGR
jgi:hypothetical protein